MVLFPTCQCCGCQTCIDISKVVSVPAYGDGKCHPTDSQTCTITIPDAYSLPVTVRLSGYVDDDVKFNGSILEPGKYIYADGCNGAHTIGTADSGPGYVDKTVSARTFTLTLLDNFGAVSSIAMRVCVDPLNTQGVCLAPTSDCQDPPPPIVQCCQRVEECEGVTIAKCVNVRADVCCKSYAYGTETDCSGSNPPYTACTAGGPNPNSTPPYDCANEAFAFGAYVHVSGWSSCFECTGLSAELAAIFAEIDAVVNQTWYVPMTCLGNATKTYTFPGGSEVGGEWTVVVFVDLCNRDCTITFANAVGIGTTVYRLQLYLSSLTKTDSPCNSFQVCECVAYSGGDVDGSGNGTLLVNASP
jgi:hypothetical protein